MPLSWRLRTRANRGQAAVIFLLLMALILVFTVSTMNLGEVARLRTSTANAADSGALAAASWVASSENEAALIAQAMSLNMEITQAIFLVPFCWSACYLALTTYLSLWLTNSQLQAVANNVTHTAWDNAKATAIFTAVQNSTIDDPSGQVNQQVRQLSEQFQATRSIPDTVTFDWTRLGSGRAPEPSSLTISIAMGSTPRLTMGGWAPITFCLGPPCAACCIWCGFACCWPCLTFPAWGGGGGDVNQIITDAGEVPSMGGGGWVSLAGIIRVPTINTCFFCFPIPLTVPGSLVTPDDLTNSNGDVTVTVTQHRAGGANVAGETTPSIWKMFYPDQFVSSAVAHYGGVEIGNWWSEPNASAELRSVQ